MVAACQAGTVLLRSSPYAYAPAAVAYAAAPVPVVYSAPKVTNVEVPTPVLTKTNLNVLTDDDKISTTEVRGIPKWWHRRQI